MLKQCALKEVWQYIEVGYQSKSMASMWSHAVRIVNVEIVRLVAIIPGISLAVLSDSPVATQEPLPPPTMSPDGCKRNGGLDKDTNTAGRFQPGLSYAF